MGLRIAGRTVEDPMTIWRDYVRHYPGTLREYDLGGRGDAGRLTDDEALRSRKIGSRLTKEQCDRIIERAADCPWSSIPAGTSLSDADPETDGGIFDKAAALYWHFTHPGRIRGVRVAKLHKILHLKRPDLYPILDSKVRRLYRDQAMGWVSRLSRLGVTIEDSPPYWAAIRDDLVFNTAQLDAYRKELDGDSDPAVRSMAGLTNQRLQDIVAWRIARDENCLPAQEEREATSTLAPLGVSAHAALDAKGSHNIRRRAPFTHLSRHDAMVSAK